MYPLPPRRRCSLLQEWPWCKCPRMRDCADQLRFSPQAIFRPSPGLKHNHAFSCRCFICLSVSRFLYAISSEITFIRLGADPARCPSVGSFKNPCFVESLTMHICYYNFQSHYYTLWSEIINTYVPEATWSLYRRNSVPLSSMLYLCSALQSCCFRTNEGASATDLAVSLQSLVYRLLKCALLSCVFFLMRACSNTAVDISVFCLCAPFLADGSCTRASVRKVAGSNVDRWDYKYKHITRGVRFLGYRFRVFLL